MKRRAFLTSAGTTLALAGFGPHPAAAVETVRWSRALARTLVGQSFWLDHPEARALAITLVAVREPDANKRDARLEQFSLVFRAPAGIIIAEGTYDIDHASLGRFAMHIAQAGREGKTPLYRSDFNVLA